MRAREHEEMEDMKIIDDEAGSPGSDVLEIENWWWLALQLSHYGRYPKKGGYIL